MWDITGNLHPAPSVGHWETEQALQSCVSPRDERQVRSSLRRKSQRAKCTFPVPVARRCSSHMQNPEVAVGASQAGTPQVSVLTARAQPLHLQPVEIKGEAEREAQVPLGGELEGICNHRKKGFKEKYYTSLSACCSCCISAASAQHPAPCGQARGSSGLFSSWLNSTSPHTWPWLSPAPES